MPDWPRLTEPALLERLALPDEAVRTLVADFVEALPLPAYSEAFVRQALGYPWSRPEGSFLLDGVEVTPLTDGAAVAAAHADLLAHDGDAGPRHPLLAIGSNAAPSTLVRKFAHRPAQERRVLAVTGHLGGFDIGPLPGLALYGSVPATVFASPGTQVRATVLWVTAAQLTALTWTELSYMLGRLEPVDFQPDHPSPLGPAMEVAYLYVSRWGNLVIDGEPVALAALPAQGRTARPMTQEQLLDLAAGLVLGDQARARDLVERLTLDSGNVIRATGDALAELAVPFASDRWTELRS